MLLWWLVALVFRWRFQFGIRTLLILVVAVALPSSWLAVEMKTVNEQSRAVEVIKASGASVEYDWQYGKHGVSFLNSRPAGPAWLRKLMGDNFFASVFEVSFGGADHVTDTTLEHIRNFTELRELVVGNLQFKSLEFADGDASIWDSNVNPSIEDLLWLRNTNVTDAGLENLKGLTQIRGLWLDGTQVTDVGLERISG